MSTTITVNGNPYIFPDDFEQYNQYRTYPGTNNDYNTNLMLDLIAERNNSLNTTSATSNNISTGSKTFTIAEEKTFQVGSWITIAQTSAPGNILVGYVTSISGTTLGVEVTSTTGSGSSITDWSIALSGEKGATGTSTMDVLGTTLETSIADGDLVLIYDLSDTVNKSIAKSDLIKNVPLTALASGTQGKVLIYGASGVPSSVGPGTSGQVLTSNGSAANPSFQAPASGALSFIETKTLSSDATCVIDSLDSSAYDSYVFEFINVVQSSTGGMTTHLSDDGGSSYYTGASDYQFIASGYESGSTTESVAVSGGSSFIRAMVGVFDSTFGGSTDEPLNGEFKIFNPHESGKKTTGSWNSTHFREGGSDLVDEKGSFCENTARQIDTVKFTAGAGTLTGTINVYGVKNS